MAEQEAVNFKVVSSNLAGGAIGINHPSRQDGVVSSFVYNPSVVQVA